MKEFLELYDPHEKQFGDIKLIGICNPLDFSVDVTTREMISSVVDYIEKRFVLHFLIGILNVTLNHKKSKS